MYLNMSHTVFSTVSVMFITVQDNKIKMRGLFRE